MDIASIYDLDAWRQCLPGWSITETQALADRSDFGGALSLDESAWRQCERTLHEEGYLAYPAWFEAAWMDRLAAGIERLAKLDVPPVFAFVYDEFWDLLLRLEPLLTRILDDHEFPAAVWIWRVTADQPTAFPPHRDQVRDAGLGEEDHLEYLTVWLPLTDLDHTTSNLCLLPASCDRDYGRGINRSDIPDLQDIRCLQGPRGSVFAWTTGLIHWGTRQPRQGPPRISVGIGCQSPDAICYDPPILDFYQPWSLESRLRVIAGQIRNYAGSLDSRWLDWAASQEEPGPG